jgi:hypothetical protein
MLRFPERLAFLDLFVRDDLEWNCCSKGHIWGSGSVGTSLCGHLGWQIDGSQY